MARALRLYQSFTINGWLVVRMRLA